MSWTQTLKISVAIMTGEYVSSKYRPWELKGAKRRLAPFNSQGTIYI